MTDGSGIWNEARAEEVLSPPYPAEAVAAHSPHRRSRHRGPNVVALVAAVVLVLGVVGFVAKTTSTSTDDATSKAGNVRHATSATSTYQGDVDSDPYDGSGYSSADA